MFTLGFRNLTVVTDHKPLTWILNDRNLNSITNPRILRFKENTLPFNFRLILVKGESHAIKTADAMSRYLSGASDSEDDVARTTKAFAVTQGNAIESVTWETVNSAAAEDEECRPAGVSEVFRNERGVIRD